MASDRIPSRESLLELLKGLPDEEIDVLCLRIMTTTDRKVHHWHYTKDGEWSPTIGTQG